MIKLNFKFKKNKELNKSEWGLIGHCFTVIIYTLSMIKSKLEGRVPARANILKILDKEMADYTTLLENVRKM